jgi:hypothetical protein
MRLEAKRSLLSVGLLITAGLLAACSAQGADLSPAEAGALADEVDPIAEDVFAGLSEADYARHSSHFDEEFKEQIDEIVVFPQVVDEVIGKVGAYQSHEMISVADDGRYRVVTYDVTFADDPHVEARIFFWKDDPQHRIAGLTFDSPSLRGE